MTLAAERHDGRLWLVAYEAPGAATCILLAEFQSEDAMETWKAVHARQMCVAREVGRRGLG